MTNKLLSAVLLIEDNMADALLLREMFKDSNWQTVEVLHVSRMVEAESQLRERSFDLVLLDLGLPDAQGLEAVRRTRLAAPNVPLVVLSGMDDESMAIKALREGAQDYLIKGQIEPRQLVRALRYALERKNIEEALFSEKERAQSTLDCIGDAVATTDIFGKITYLNPVAERLTGWSWQSAMNTPASEVFRIVDSSTGESLPSPTQMAFEQNRIVHMPMNCSLIQRDGSEIPVEDSAAPIKDRDGNPTGAVIVLRDVTVARRMTQQIAHAATHDFLTGLPNRLFLTERMKQAISLAQRHRSKVAVLYLDLDGFKHINDSLGHSTGDKVLQSIAKRLVRAIRTPDTVSRQGGDEFLVLISEIDHPDGSAVVAARLLDLFSSPHWMDGHDLHLSVSMGISIYPDDGLDPETLIKCADMAMYQAKESGRQSYRFFTPSMNVRALKRQSIEEDLRRALAKNEMELHYQPKVNLATGAITGAEALLRWTHPTRGSVPPSDFIPIAEDCGLILSIGSWVLSEACARASEWLAAGLPPITMAVNVSALQFRNAHFLQELFQILGATGFDPRSLELEVTESILMKQAEFSTPILHTLRERGVRVAIDDFGTGYSSLSYLQRFPLDALKIDQSFVRQLAIAPDETSIVRAVISMGQSLNLLVIAEGVETVEDLKFLQAHHCDEAQGYYFSRPVPHLQFAKLLADDPFRFPEVETLLE